MNKGYNQLPGAKRCASFFRDSFRTSVIENFVEFSTKELANDTRFRGGLSTCDARSFKFGVDVAPRPILMFRRASQSGFRPTTAICESLNA
jgi:hypothetical protein